MDDTKALQPTAPDSEGEFDLVALTPAHLRATQQQLTEWCVAKRQALARELADLEEHLLIATNNGWKPRGLQASITRTARRIDYYDKIETAVKEGYLMVPNFPISLLAVRVQRTTPRFASAGYEGSSKFDAQPEFLPQGTGRYVDDRVFHIDQSYETSDGKGGTRRERLYVASNYDAPDFPYQLVKPAVIEATERAMRLKVFDQIGMVENRSGGDPIMVGQLIDPRGRQRRCTFFIAWWLNTRSL